MRVTMVVNGGGCDFDLEPHRTLVDVLREDCWLTSAHPGCADGTCGACTVLVDSEAVRSCLMLAVQCDRAHVRTAEGLALDLSLRAVLTAASATHCALCLPGVMMLAAGALGHDPGLAGDPDRLRRLLGSNACRCTDDDVIQRAVMKAAR